MIPDSKVVVGTLPPNSTVAVEIDQHGSAIRTIPSVGGTITVPSETFVDAFANRVSLRLVVNGGYYGGTISFLPREESESFDLVGFYKNDGSFVVFNQYRSTELISVEDVVDIVVTTTAAGQARALVCYDENENFVRVLLATGTFTNRHIVPDGTYKYIASSCNTANERSLVLYFRRRRR